MTTTAATPIRITGPDGLLAVVPTMLGFHPTNSLVLICLSGGRRRVGPVARVDLPPGHDRALAAQLAGHAVHHADEVAVVIYQDRRRRPPLLADVLSALGRTGVSVMDAIEVRGGMAYPALGSGAQRSDGFPVPGADDPQMRLLTAAAALSGRTVLPDRDALRRSIAAPTGRRLRDAERNIAAMASGTARPGPGTSNGTGKKDQGRAIDGTGVDLFDLIGPALAQAAATGGVEGDIAAAVAVGLTDPLQRDAVLALAVNELDRPWIPMLISCATWTPPFLAGPLCAVLAVVGYRHGDGALAQVALDRCLEAEPENSLGHLMIAIIAAGVRPEAMADLVDGPPVDDSWFDLP